jgi:hypothetical protein
MEFQWGCPRVFYTGANRTADMKRSGKALLIVVALALGGFAGHPLASETAPQIPDYLDDCVVDEQSDCAQRCITEHNCCIKSCNWVDKRDKSKCLKQCKSILKKCYRECDQKPAADKAKGSLP